MGLVPCSSYKATIDFFKNLGNEVSTAQYDLSIASTLLPLISPDFFQPCVIVAGTNGKGSVSWWLAEIFRQAGYRTALYTSPHLIDIRERIRINGKPISKRIFFSNVNRVICCVAEMSSCLPRKPTYYEWLTLTAASCFLELKPEIHILEIGMGGRLDAVNSADPILSIITSVGLDHQRLLGNTINAISREKMGILRCDVPVVIGPQDEWSHELQDELKEKAKRVIYARPIYEQEFCQDNRGENEVSSWSLGLNGHFQHYNAATVITACRQLRESGWNLDDSNIRDGLKSNGWPGRLEKLSENPSIIIDGAHNLQAIKEIVRDIEDNNLKPVVLFGAMKDKNYPEMIETILPHVCFLVLTQIPFSSRAAGKIEFRPWCDSGRALFEPDITAAMNLANKYTDKKSPIYVLGSLYLAAEIKRMFRKNH